MKRKTTISTFVCIGFLALGTAAVAGGGSTPSGGTPGGDPVDPPDPVPVEGDPFDACGVLHLEPAVGLMCANFETDNGELYLLDTTGGFEDGASVCVTGIVQAGSCFPFCGDLDGCVIDATIVPASSEVSFAGCGTILAGDDGGSGGDCVLFEGDETGDILELDLTSARGLVAGSLTGQHIFLSGIMSTDSCSSACDVDGCLVVEEFGTCMTPGDLDGDGSVGPADLAQLLGAWGACPSVGECGADLNGDSSVGPADLALLLGSWG